MVNELAGDILRLHVAQKFAAVLLVKLHEHIGGLVSVEQPVEILRLLQVKLLEKLRYIRRVEIFQHLLRSSLVVRVGDMPDVIDIFFVKLLHRSVTLNKVS